MTKNLIMAVLIGFFATGQAQAHKASDSFLYWGGDGEPAMGRLDIALMDISRVLPIDRNADGELTWGEVKDQQASILGYLAERVTVIAATERCPLSWRVAGLTQHSDGNYLATEFRPQCAADDLAEGQLDYQLFFDDDPLHRALVQVSGSDGSYLSALSPGQRTLKLASDPGLIDTMKLFIREGMVHLWIGYDHILFLLALMLPVALRREDGKWVHTTSVRTAIKEVALVVTAFTFAHSITLALATLGWVRVNIYWVETLIALSIVVAAINIVWPILGNRRYLLGFGFGLIHGFGFASVLADAVADTNALAVALISFNIGVELAQLIVVMLFVPLIFMLRTQRFYQAVVLPVSVAAISMTGVYWVWDRAPVF